MQKNGRVFTFLFSYRFRSRVFIRRVEIPKAHVQNGVLGLAFVFMVSALGVGAYGVLNSFEPAIINNSIAQAPAQVATIVSDPKLYDYTRPAASSQMAQNAGGPALSELSSEDAEIESQLRVIETTADPVTIPNIWAHSGKINNEFGFRRNPFGGRSYEFHAGMDIDGERGDTVVAPGNGVVTKSGWQGGYGNMIEIDHGNGLTTRYGHLSKVEVNVGDEIVRGQLIGFVGSTGRSTGPHLHYELRLNDRPINPRRFLPTEPIEIARN